MKARITPRPDGPYRLTIEDGSGSATDILRGPGGEAYPVAQEVFLCRCGASKKKPFCDGTHRTNGFTSQPTADPAANRRTTYVGREITIFDNRAICAHAGVCTDALKEVFREEGEPWIDADGAAVAKMIETIDRCPSGALGYALQAEEAAESNGAATVTVTRDGPYAVMGAVELVDTAFGDGAKRARYTLCRCGASKNKPFCDGSHWEIQFRDPGPA